MSPVEDVRQAFQDVVAPDLKALTVRVDHLEVAVREGFAKSDQALKEAIAASESRAAERQKNLEVTLDLRDKVLQTRLDVITETLKAVLSQQDALLKGLQLERRIERMETAELQRQRKPEEAAGTELARSA